MITTLDANTRIGALLDEHSFLLETITGHAPELSKLRNPLLRKTFARLATLGDAARLGGTELEPLLQTIAGEIRARTGRQVGTGGGAAERHIGHHGLPDQAGPRVPAQPSATGAEATAATPDYRVDELKAMLRELHAGTAASELAGRFASLLEKVSATEIAEAEQQMVAEGLPEEEIKRLCDVHAAVFRGQPKQQAQLLLPADHPLAALQDANRDLTRAAAEVQGLLAEIGQPAAREAFDERRGQLELALQRLTAVERQYEYKENRLFPLLEGYGIEAPPKVMWAAHDDVRALLRRALAAVREGDIDEVAATGHELARIVTEMVTKEEQILFPLCLETFAETDWQQLAAPGAMDAGGPARSRSAAKQPAEARAEHRTEQTTEQMEEHPADHIQLRVGQLTSAQLTLLFGNLPVDITYVDEHDRVRFYSEGHRIFPREPEIIGRRVQNCHPPKSVHVVEDIISQFRQGHKDVAEFWLDFRGRFVHIQYIALRDADGTYRGVLEVAQDATRVRSLEGERRLLNW